MKNDLIGHVLKCSDAKGRMVTGFRDHRTRVQDWGQGGNLETIMH